MTSSNQPETNLSSILKRFSSQYISHYQQEKSHLPIIVHDEQWPSRCELKSINNDKFLSDDETFWQPFLIKEDQSLNFKNVESALEMELHPDIKIYFTTFYSENLSATCKEGDLSLLFAWNKDDFYRLQENLIGHILMKRRLKQAETIFFAVTDEEDTIISVDNSSGSVWVERVGCKPHKKIADSLTQFINQLSPITT